MGGIFGGGTTISNAEPRLNGFRINTSCYGGAIPIVFGTTRVSGNIIDYIDFTAIPHTTKQTSGKGGKTTVENTTYTYTVAVAVGICEGSIKIGRIWAGKDVKKLSDLGLQLYYNQVWPYVVGKYNDRAVTYKNITYCAGVSDLGNSDSLPQLNFEVIGKEYTPVDMLVNLMTDTNYGVGLHSRFLGDLSDFKTYCTAVGIKLAAGITDIQEAQEILSDLVKCANSEFLWSNGQLTIRPYCESAVNGNGVSYDPDITIQYNLTDDDFIDQEGDDPVQIMRSISADAYNCIKVEFVNAINEYNVDIAEAKDTADIELNGLREAETANLHYIHDRDTATSIAYMLLHKNLYVRNRCKFTLGYKYCLLEVFDIVTITDQALGYINRPVRILEITENEDGTSEYEAEECLLGVEYSIDEITNPNDNIYDDTTNVGMVNPPIIFTAPLALSGGKLEVWLAVSGKEKDWGGCQLWTSWDDASYRYVISKYGPSITGRLVNYVSANALEFVIDVSESRCPLYSVSPVDAANMASLCYLDGEFFTYEIAELIGEYQYKLKNLVRGLCGVSAAEHDAGKGFARLDSTIQKMEITQALASQTAYIKFTSFDTKGGNTQYIDTVKAYSYMVTLPSIPVVEKITLTRSGATGVIADFIVQQSNEYLFSEVYYREEIASDAETPLKENEFIYGGMDRMRVTVQSLIEGKLYLFKVLPVISNNIKGDLDSAKGKTIQL